MIRESYAYNSIRTKDSKICYPNSHSLWENVSQMSPNVCGVYVPLNRFVEEKYVPIRMKLIIPFTDQLALQAWKLYPNRILGEIEEEINTSLNALVWCQIQPKTVGEIKKNYLEFRDYELNAPILPLNNCFSQIGSPGIIVNRIGYAKEYIKNYQNFCDSNKIDSAGMRYLFKMNTGFNTLVLKHGSQPLIKVGRTNLMGFGIKPQVVEGLLQSLHEPIIIPSQELTRYIFEQNVNEREINVRRFVPLRNATNITMMFPARSNECTVFQNIMHKNAQLRIDKRLYPHLEFENTWDGRFVQYQLMANELDGNEAPREFLESISKPLNLSYFKDENGNIEFNRTVHNLYDNTNFGINFQLERGNAGYVFDGLDTDSRDVEIQFKAQSISIDSENPYYYPDKTSGVIDFDFIEAPSNIVYYVDYKENSTIHPPQPEMWICSDTYWTWSIENGVQYHKEGVPMNYE